MLQGFNKQLGYLLILATVLGCFFFIKDTGLLVDENWHYSMILRFLEGNFAKDAVAAQIPGYHLVMAGLSLLVNSSSLQTIRAMNMAFGLLSMWIFSLLLTKMDGKIDANRLLHFVFFPIILPFVFLVYTDVLSVLLVLLGFYLSLGRRYTLSGLVLCLSLAVRQTNIIWLVMIACLSYCSQEGFACKKELAVSLLKSYWTYWGGLVLFVAFVIVNGGVAVGDASWHPVGFIYTGNVFFICFLYFFLFLPSIISHFPRILQYLRESQYVVIWFALLLTLYMFTFDNRHPLNSHDGGHYFLRNFVLIFFTSSTVTKLIFFIPIFVSVVDMIIQPLKSKPFYLVYPFTILFLLPHGLIEQRYYIVPFALLLLFRELESPEIEKLTGAIYAMVSIVFLYGIQRNQFFL